MYFWKLENPNAVGDLGSIFPLRKNVIIAFAPVLHALTLYDDQSCISSSCVGRQEKGSVDDRKGDGETAMPKKIQYRRHREICFMLLTPMESHVIHGEKETIKRKKLFKAVWFPTYHTGWLHMDLRKFLFLRIGRRYEEIERSIKLNNSLWIGVLVTEWGRLLVFLSSCPF